MNWKEGGGGKSILATDMGSLTTAEEAGMSLRPRQQKIWPAAVLLSFLLHAFVLSVRPHFQANFFSPALPPAAILVTLSATSLPAALKMSAKPSTTVSTRPRQPYIRHQDAAAPSVFVAAHPQTSVSAATTDNNAFSLNPEPAAPIPSGGSSSSLASNPSAGGIATADAGHAAAGAFFSAASGADKQARSRYMQQILALIEAHKFYPPMAQRRHMEGSVRVSFVLRQDGGISDLVVTDGLPLLAQAAAQAVRLASPLPPPQGLVETPVPVSYLMEFRLR